MTEHLAQEQIEEYRRQSLPASELLSVSDHLFECGACRQQVERGLGGDHEFLMIRSGIFDELVGAAPPASLSVHLSVEQSADYVDGKLSGDELRSITDHLSRCEQCEVATEDLRVFSRQLAPNLDNEYRPVAAVSESRPKRNLLDSLSWLWPKTSSLAFGSIAAIILVALTSWLVWRSAHQTAPEKSSPKEVAVESPGPPRPSPSKPAQPATQVVARLNDGGGELTLDAEGKLGGAGGLPPAYQNMIRDALSGQLIERPSALNGLTRPPSALMGTDVQTRSFSLVEPVGKVLFSDRPIFRWSRLQGAASYIVELYDDRFALVASSPQLTTNFWSVEKKLSRGAVYFWQVKAIKDGQEVTSPRPPAPQAKFRILDRATARVLTDARREYPTSHLTLGLLFVQAGLLDEAQQEFQTLEKSNPNSEIARKLRATVHAMRR